MIFVFTREGWEGKGREGKRTKKRREEVVKVGGNRTKRGGK